MDDEPSDGGASSDFGLAGSVPGCPPDSTYPAARRAAAGREAAKPCRNQVPSMAECYRCGQEGHRRSECPQDSPLPASESHSDRPPWCGSCDPRTRLFDHGAYARRCPSCWAWPAKGTYPGELPAQYKRCVGCNVVVYAWEMRPCGEHQALALTRG